MTLAIIIIQCLYSSEPFPPPTNVQLVDAKPGEVTFSWTPPSQHCPSLTYSVIAENCGICQNNLMETTCKYDTLATIDVCTIRVYSVICRSLISTNSSNIVRGQCTVLNAIYACKYLSFILQFLDFLQLNAFLTILIVAIH